MMVMTQAFQCGWYLSMGVKHILGCNGDNLWSVVAVNGIIIVGENESYGGVVQIKFISDTAIRLRGTYIKRN